MVWAIEIRFRKERKPLTMLSYLEKTRLDHLARLLETTDQQAKEACARVGLVENTHVAGLHAIRIPSGKS
ncbi:MAG: hypothetical protein IJ654_09525 [Bacteroidales bacterium]|nr:hypothetical protein [Bacteroidales bacterium]